MEHRLGTRKSVLVAGAIIGPSGQRTPCEIRDIGWHGLYVRAGCDGLGQNAPLEVAFSLDGQNEFRLPACIVRTDGEGFGAMFTRNAGEALNALRTAG